MSGLWFYVSSAVFAASSPAYSEQQAVLDTWVNQALDCDFSQNMNLSLWNCGVACDSAPLSNVKVLRDKRLHTYGIAAHQGAECLLAFRGTKDIRNSITDANMFLKNPWGEVACQGCRVHSGWYNAYASLKGQARSALAELGCSQTTLRITGHSLGAAMASIAAFELAEDYRLSAVYTYGQPRTGNAAWVEEAASRLRGAAFFRVVDFKDPVPHLSSGEHQSPEVYYDATRLGAFQVCEAIEQQNCSQQWRPIETASHACEHCSYLGMNPCDCGSTEPRCMTADFSVV